MSGFSPAKTLMRVYAAVTTEPAKSDRDTNTVMPQEPEDRTPAAKYLSNKHAFHKLPQLLPLLCMTEPRWHPATPPPPETQQNLRNGLVGFL